MVNKSYYNYILLKEQMNCFKLNEPTIVDLKCPHPECITKDPFSKPANLKTHMKTKHGQDTNGAPSQRPKHTIGVLTNNMSQAGKSQFIVIEAIEPVYVYEDGR